MAIPETIRLEGESDEEFRRRRKRDQMRAYRAAKPKTEPKLRGADAKPRKNSPFTLEEWETLKRQPGETEDDWRRRGQRARDAIFSGRHPGARAARSRVRYKANPEAEKARNKAYNEANREKVAAAASAYYHANKAKRVAALVRWREENPERYEAKKKAWYDNNRALRNSYSARWRRQARIATPPWADSEKMLAVYAEAIRISEETGIEHQVDHFYPLRGKTVSGLHCEANLRIIPAVENMRKQNKHPEDWAA